MKTLTTSLIALALAATGGVMATTAYATDKPPVTWVPAYSGNYTAVSYNRGIQYVVIHVTEGSGTGAASWFQNPASHVSAHYIVQFDGSITQCVQDKDIAWHAGNWTYNTHSIGIEHAGYTYQNLWTAAQYAKSAQLTAWICETYGVPKNHTWIIGHSEVPDPDGTGYGGSGGHTDPGPYFNWEYYISLVNAAPPPPTPTVTLPKAMSVTTGTLNVRSGPSTSNSIIGTVASGQKYVAIAADGSWRKIYYAGNTGWCYSGYLAPQSNTAVSKVAVSALNVRSGPSTSYSIVGTAHSPEMYVRLATSSGWHKIYFGGSARWFSGGYVTSTTVP